MKRQPYRRLAGRRLGLNSKGLGLLSIPQLAAGGQGTCSKGSAGTREAFHLYRHSDLPRRWGRSGTSEDTHFAKTAKSIPCIRDTGWAEAGGGKGPLHGLYSGPGRSADRRSACALVDKAQSLGAGSLVDVDHCDGGSWRVVRSVTREAATTACAFTVKLRGRLDGSRLSLVRQALQRRETVRRALHRDVDLHVDVDSPGGALFATLEIGRRMRTEGASIAVGQGASCLSACVLHS